MCVEVDEQLDGEECGAGHVELAQRGGVGGAVHEGLAKLRLRGVDGEVLRARGPRARGGAAAGVRFALGSEAARFRMIVPSGSRGRIRIETRLRKRSILRFLGFSGILKGRSAFALRLWRPLIIARL